MAICRAALAEAVAEHVSAEVAGRLDAAWSVTAPTPDESDAEAGRALAISLSTLPAGVAAAQVDALTLHEAELQSGDSIMLTPAEAFSHAMLGDWAPATFSEALGECICGGRIGSNLAASAPAFASYLLSEEGGKIHSATAFLHFEARCGLVVAVLRYGAPCAAPFARNNVVTGNAVYAVGMALRGTGLPALLSGAEPASPHSPGALH